MGIKKDRSPWAWVPTLYFYQGVPYSIVMITSGLIYKTMGISIASFAFWTSLLYLPWTIKPLWSPYVDVVSTKRNWVVWTQLGLGLAFIAAGILYGPGKAANAGGVAVSGLEQSQNSLRMSWTREEVDEKLKGIMSSIHDKCVRYGTEDNGYINYVKGANIAGFVKVADAMISYGAV